MVDIKITKLRSETDFNIGYIKYLSLERRIKIINYKNNGDKKRSLISELLIRKAVFEKYNIPITKVKISYNPYGKPYIDNIRHFKFNISHSGDYIVLATSRHRIGIDIEHIKKTDMSIARRFFTINEYKYIDSQESEEDKTNAFYKLWTLKESYIKAVGKGLKIPLNSFEFNIQNDQISLKNNSKYKFKFKSYKIDNYMLSVCHQEKDFNNNFTYITEEELYKYIKGAVR